MLIGVQDLLDIWDQTGDQTPLLNFRNSGKQGYGAIIFTKYFLLSPLVFFEGKLVQLGDDLLQTSEQASDGLLFPLRNCLQANKETKGHACLKVKRLLGGTSFQCRQRYQFAPDEKEVGPLQCCWLNRVPAVVDLSVTCFETSLWNEKQLLLCLVLWMVRKIPHRYFPRMTLGNVLFYHLLISSLKVFIFQEMSLQRVKPLYCHGSVV